MKPFNSFHRSISVLTICLCVSAGGGLVAQVVSAPAAPGTISPDVSGLKAVNQLPPQLVGQGMSPFIAALGNRFADPALARTSLVGTLSIPGSPDAPITIVRENPGRIQIVQGSALAQVTSVVDQQSQKATAGMSGTQAKLAETLLYECPDFLLFDHANFGGTRRIGDGFPYARAAPASRYTIFDHVTDISLVAPGTIRRKRFYFNQTTGLLDYVVSWIGSGATQVTTETAITWRKTGTEQLPSSITHWENGVQLFIVQFAQGAAIPTATDSVFTPQAK